MTSLPRVSRRPRRPRDNFAGDRTQSAAIPDGEFGAGDLDGYLFQPSVWKRRARLKDEPTLGMTVYWMLYYTAFMRGLWWWILAPVGVLVILFVGLYLVSQGLDEFANPRLRARGA